MIIFNRKSRKGKYLFSLLFCCLLCGCISTTEKIGQFLDGSGKENKQTSLYRAYMKDSLDTDFEIAIVKNKKDELSMLISITKFPMMRLRATYPDSNNTIYLISLEYLSGSSQGWNEYSLALLGEGRFYISEISQFAITANIEPVQITTGRIQKRDTRITGEEGVTALRNRRERILALTEWMKNQNAPKTFINTKSFNDYWKPILFPEQVSGKKKPANWRQESDVLQKAENIMWNTGYSERVFPEELRPVRDSGTLLMDWEEAISWIHIEYEWKYITDLLSCQIQLNKIK